MLGWGVMLLEPFDLSFKLEPVPTFGAVQWVWESVQFEGLADGADHDLDGASAYLDALAAGTRADMLGKGSEEFDSLVGGDVCELGVHTMERGDEQSPMVPIAEPFCVSRRHDASVDASPFSSEKTREVILVFRQKPCHEQSLNLVG